MKIQSKVRYRTSQLSDEHADLLLQGLQPRPDRLEVPGERQLLGSQDVEGPGVLVGPGLLHRAYVFSNFYSNFWLILPNFERLILGCIEAKFCK